MSYKMIIEKNNEIFGIESKEDLLITIDDLHSQDIFINIQLEFFKSILLGKNVEQAEQDMQILEDKYIKEYKKLKYISLPLLWNKKNRKIIRECKNKGK